MSITENIIKYIINIPDIIKVYTVKLIYSSLNKKYVTFEKVIYSLLKKGYLSGNKILNGK